MTITSSPRTRSNLPSVIPAAPGTRVRYSRLSDIAAPGGGSAAWAIAGAPSSPAITAAAATSRFIPRPFVAAPVRRRKVLQRVDPAVARAASACAAASGVVRSASATSSTARTVSPTAHALVRAAGVVAARLELDGDVDDPARVDHEVGTQRIPRACSTAASASERSWLFAAPATARQRRAGTARRRARRRVRTAPRCRRPRAAPRRARPTPRRAHRPARRPGATSATTSRAPRREGTGERGRRRGRGRSPRRCGARARACPRPAPPRPGWRPRRRAPSTGSDRPSRRAPARARRRRGALRDHRHVGVRRPDVLRGHVAAVEPGDGVAEVQQQRRGAARLRAAGRLPEHDHALATAERQVGDGRLDRIARRAAARRGPPARASPLPHIRQPPKRGAAHGGVDGDHAEEAERGPRRRRAPRARVARGSGRRRSSGRDRRHGASARRRWAGRARGGRTAAGSGGATGAGAASGGSPTAASGTAGWSAPARRRGGGAAGGDLRACADAHRRLVVAGVGAGSGRPDERVDHPRAPERRRGHGGGRRCDAARGGGHMCAGTGCAATEARAGRCARRPPRSGPCRGSAPPCARASAPARA